MCEWKITIEKSLGRLSLDLMSEREAKAALNGIVAVDWNSMLYTLATSKEKLCPIVGAVCKSGAKVSMERCGGSPARAALSKTGSQP